HHSMEQRLSRWLLDCLNRVPSSPLQVRPQLLAEFFGVPVENLLRIVQSMQECGLKLSETHIVVADRNALQACACECHTLIQAKISQWLPRVNIN
ncbi:MAG TPA: helix-turn-helix domain-containing protein, partial [Methylophilaceae bacterium]|nr:helix-turn-helix domain-containing protein [Methylophilaceae bacterium]